jgi:hypothetical protein
MRKIWKRVCTGILALATVITALPITSVHAAETQYWTESAERVGYIEHVMNDGTIHSTFNEGHMKVEGETAYCVDINTNFQNGYKTRHDASASMSAAQIEDVALSLEYVKQYTGSHTNLNANQRYLLEQCVVWQRLSEHGSVTMSVQLILKSHRISKMRCMPEQGHLYRKTKVVTNVVVIFIPDRDRMLDSSGRN